MTAEAPANPPLDAEARARVRRLKERAAILSVVASVALTLGKAVAAYLSGSLALMSEALHGLIDIAATLTTWFAIRIADKPADDEHHYGHGKVESLAALAETALLFALAGAVAWEAGSRLWAGVHAPVQVTPLVIGVLVAAILIDGTRWRALHIVARDTQSEALAADALHFASDLVSSLLTLFGLLMVLAGQSHGDAVAALGVSLFIVVAAARLGARTIGTLIDAAPKGLREQIEEAALAVDGVEAVDWVRLRPGGGRTLGEVGVKVARTLPLDEVTAIKAKLAAELARVAPGAELTLTANPTQTERENALERIMLIAALQKAPVHHVSLYTNGQTPCITLDLEVDATMSLAAAHEIATRLEEALKAEFGAQTEVETHIEPLRIVDGESRNSEWSVVESVGRVLAAAADSGGVIRDVHSLRVRRTPAGLVVNFHCRADADLDVATVHAAVDRIERAVRADRPDIVRVAGHAEPLPKDG
jgi:cation diffusion facilitator family transporter